MILRDKKDSPVFARTILALLVLGAGMAACNFQNMKDGTSSSNASDVMIGHVSYAMVDQTVLSPSCTHCHGNAGGINLQSYAGASGAADKIRDAVFNSKSMPKTGGLDPYQRAVLQAWLDEGAPQDATGGKGNGAPAPEQPIEITDLNFANLNATIFKPLCSKCHGNGQGIDLSTYANVKANIAQVALAAIAEQSMPPATSQNKPLPQPTTAQLALLSAWINAGAPETAPAALVEPNYQSIYTNVFVPMCMSCHGSGGFPKKAPLAPYSALMSAKTDEGEIFVIPAHSTSSRLVEVLSEPADSKERMPPAKTGLAMLPKSVVDVISQWIENGAPEN